MKNKIMKNHKTESDAQNPAFLIGAVSLSTFYNGDCLLEMDKIADKSVDMILCDLPYGTTACKWDSVIPFEPLWKQYERVIKDNGAIVLTGSQPFTSVLVMSNIKMFKYEWIFEKDRPTNPLLAKKQPMKYHENICVFYKKQCTYNYIMEKKKTENIRTDCRGTGSHISEITGSTAILNGDSSTKIIFPRSIQKHNRVQGNIHPTQKPVSLMEYLIKTYTNEGETVLDNCMGSGTTGCAAKKIGRHFTGIEKDEKYFKIAVDRVSAYC